jgi:hypothetical protein
VAPEPVKESSSKLKTVKMEGVADIATIHTMQAMLEGAISNLKMLAKERAINYFLDIGCKIEERPDNFTGEEDGHSVTMMLNKRSTSSVLSDDEVTLLTEHGIPISNKVIKEETYVFNPVYLSDKALMKRIENALAGVEGLPEDIIQFQQGISKKVVNEDTVNAIFKKPRDVAEKLLPVVTTFGFKPKANVSIDNLSGLLARIGRILDMPTLRSIMMSAISNPSAILNPDKKRKE